MPLRGFINTYLAGDYDGDKVTVVWQPEIVQAFTNADRSFANPPEGIEDSFIQNTETIGELLLRVPSTELTDKLLYELQTFLLAGIRNQSVVGTYSIMHDNAVYETGYFSEQAKRLAHMLVTTFFTI